MVYFPVKHSCLYNKKDLLAYIDGPVPYGTRSLVERNGLYNLATKIFHKILVLQRCQ